MMLEMIAFCGYEHPSADEIMSANEETKFLNSLPPTEREDIRCYKNADFAMATNCKGDLELHMNVDGLESGFLVTELPSVGTREIDPKAEVFKLSVITIEDLRM
ncbi:hypothetical protein NC653_025467 [Populus alba x Populus x berolinensis]|uniref:Uncharacterized protein n=1 Tax=Populus alba x Populus x berolinensis TaxID=444605 RepID=A0AAD6MCB7_9ROSI|nr:hypothetical protein NC653_025467 [Populus alba x Populus x berolinensis]